MKKMKHAAAYKDVVAVLGNDEEALYQHYLTYGLKEGRNASIYFNAQKYRETYGDLDAAFGDNWEKYAEHYVTFGLTEARDGGGEFDAVSYAQRYPDLYEAYGYDLAKLSEHYEVFGVAENRNVESQVVVEEREAIIKAAEADKAEDEATPSERVEEEYNEAGFHYVYTYDAAGNLIRAEVYNPSGEWTITMELEYNASGVVIRQNETYPDGRYAVADFDENGNLLTYKVNDILMVEVVYTDNGRTEYNYDDTGALSIVEEYEGNQLISKAIYRNGIINNESYYDAATGNAVKSIYYFEDGTKSGETLYDAEGKIEKSIRYHRDGFVQIEVYYDADKNPVKEIDYHENGKISCVIEYEAGNMTKQTSYDEAGVIKRESYFNEAGDVYKSVGYENGEVSYILESTFNEAGKIVKRVDKDAEGVVTGYYEYTYADGYVCSKYYNGAGEFQYENTYEDRE